jgi:sugar phosphate isomerase/epimerase
MRYIYFTKSLQKLDIPDLIKFCKDAGLDGADMAVRPAFPVNPENGAKELPAAVKAFADAGLVIPLVSAVTTMTDPDSKDAKLVFEAAGKAEVAAVKIGYFLWKSPFDDSLKTARKNLEGFAKLGDKNKVRVLYHTHSGTYIGNNAASLRWLLQDIDPHQVGAYLDTGHTVINGGPIRTELDIVKPWLSMIAIKDMLWDKKDKSYARRIVPAGEGIQNWNDVAQGLKDCKFNGTISLHGEYDTKSQEERLKVAKEELAFLKKHFGQ